MLPILWIILKIVLIIAGVLAVLYIIAFIVIVNELVRIAMEEGETGWGRNNDEQLPLIDAERVRALLASRFRTLVIYL